MTAYYEMLNLQDYLLIRTGRIFIYCTEERTAEMYIQTEKISIDITSVGLAPAHPNMCVQKDV